MGFLERARSQRVKHQRARSMKIEEHMPQNTTGSMKRSPTRSKRKSIFPGLSANNTTTTTSEAPRPSTMNARTSVYQNQTGSDTKTDSNKEQLPLPSGLDHVVGNENFKFPSPALVSSNKKRTPPGSIAQLPTLPHNNSTTFSPAPTGSTTKLPPTWNRSVTDPVLSSTPREALPKQASTWEGPNESQPRPQVRKQKSAWKTLGSLFKGKQTRQPIPDEFYQIQPPSNDSLVRSDGVAKNRVGVLESPIASPVAKDERTVARVDSGNELLAIPGDKSNSLLTPTPANVFPPRSSSRKSENFFDPQQNADKTSDDPRRTPKLDVDLPGSGFDRYSVMFEKLLEPKVPLIERRQSKRAPLKDVAPDNEDEALSSPSGLQRSLTSPSLNRLPSLTIHVAHNNRTGRSSAAPDQYKGPMAHRPRPPKRSMTAPLAPLSPMSDPSKKTTPITARAVPLPESRSTTTASSPRHSIMSENSLPPTPNTATSLASSIQTTVFGPSSSSSTPPKAARASRVVVQASPPPPIPTRSNERPPLPRNYPAGSEPFNRHIVQVSVARQVSVSKARRRVADAVVVKQPLRPRVVELGKNRKSTLVMIEGGD